ncbi:hypothetical protein ColTof4_02518 [Colletotrichum tofieldiae]|nr:hypothetical protein ColTof3_09191 [Colletotrichum tofieldiae]GKT70095.1 hypothetical protein ColTof4_02518 [Colletotrichum tofieldiae]
MSYLANCRDLVEFVTVDRICYNHNGTDEQRAHHLSIKLDSHHCILAGIEAYSYVGWVSLTVCDKDGARFETNFPRKVVPDDPSCFSIDDTGGAMNPDWSSKVHQR